MTNQPQANESRFIDLKIDYSGMYTTFMHQLKQELTGVARSKNLAEVNAIHRMLGPLVIAMQSMEHTEQFNEVRDLLNDALTKIDHQHTKLDQEEEHRQDQAGRRLSTRWSD